MEIKRVWFSGQLTGVFFDSLAYAEIRLLLANLLWGFDLELDEETDSNWMDQKGWMVWQRKPLIVRAKRREPVPG